MIKVFFNLTKADFYKIFYALHFKVCVCIHIFFIYLEGRNSFHDPDANFNVFIQ